MLASSAEFNVLPRQLGRYELIAPLGEGGMARVYLAVQRGPIASKLVVVKLLREQFTGDEHFVAMFADESRIAALLNHPNVIHTYESSSTDSEYYIVMEFLEGKTLAQLLRRIGRQNFPLDTHLWVLCEILAGLHYAHQLLDFGGEPLNIVHRDVSPSNILITARGEVKLLDFGIAKVQGAIAETQHGIIKGKLGYASPEQCLGSKADARADVYSVGVMLWEALAGKRRPLRETALLSTRTGATEAESTEVLPGAPPALAAIVRRALAPDPADRFQTALAFELELRKFLSAAAEADGGATLRTLVVAHFGGELAAIRRTIDEQLGAARRSWMPEPRSVVTATRTIAPSSETPHAIELMPAERPRTGRLGPLSAVLLFGVAGLGLLWFTEAARSAKAPDKAEPVLAAQAPTVSGALSPGPASPAQLAAHSEPASEVQATNATAPAPAAPGSKRHHSQSPLSALKWRSVPAAAAARTPGMAAFVPLAPAETAQGGAEPGVDLRKVPTKSNVRSLDEGDPYSP